MIPAATTRDMLRSADTAAGHAHVPYSGEASGCALLLSDGQTIPGARLESASFSLLIPPLVNAFSTAAALGRTDIVAVAGTIPFSRQDLAFLAETFAGSFSPASEHIAVLDAATSLPDVRAHISPFADPAPDAAAAIALVRRIAERAVVPESSFPVGCLFVFDDGRTLPGVNVEHGDWTRVLCAERNALGTMISYGLPQPDRMYLTCLRDASCTPCGACRQLLAELVPNAALCMDRGTEAVECTTPAGLLPGFFAGSGIPGRERVDDDRSS